MHPLFFALLLLSFPATATPLQESVMVSAATLQLADLLPANAPNDLKTLAAPVSLGRAPNPGSFRIISRDEIAKAAAAEPRLGERILVPPQVIVSRRPQPIPPDDIRAAIAAELRRRGWPEDALPRELSIPPQASSTGPPQLKILSAKWDRRQQSLDFQFRCRDRQSCGNFLVRAPLPQLPAQYRDLVARAKPALAAHAGDPAMLTMRSGPLLMHIPVVCLQAGAVGETIRARDRLGKKIFRGDIVGTGKLQAVAD